jgi:hypothetical protein
VNGRRFVAVAVTVGVLAASTYAALVMALTWAVLTLSR